MNAAISPAEAMVLLNPRRVRANQVFKVTLTSLALQKVVAIKTTRMLPRLFGRIGKVTRVSVNEIPADGLPPPAAAVLGLVKAGRGSRIGTFMRRARALYGKNLRGFLTDVVEPALVSRGLLESHEGKGRLASTTHRRKLTPAGKAEGARLRKAIDRGRSLPVLLTADPKEAAAIVASLGGLILLIDELKPHYKDISNALRSHGADDFDDLDGTDPTDGYDLSDVVGSAFDAMADVVPSVDSGSDSATSSSGSDSASSSDGGSDLTSSSDGGSGGC
ncbi:MAG TPA: hypothetical protein VJY39_22295 [Acidisphaera sp.]|nr:hypothetical protein [Acidisphaera sp.]